MRGDFSIVMEQVCEECPFRSLTVEKTKVYFPDRTSVLERLVCENQEICNYMRRKVEEDLVGEQGYCNKV